MNKRFCKCTPNREVVFSVRPTCCTLKEKKAGEPNIFDSVMCYDALIRLEKAIVTSVRIKPCPGLEQLGPPPENLRATIKELNSERPMEASTLALPFSRQPRQK